MSPTVFRSRGLRFYFFSREERRIHVHVQAQTGEAKFWLEPDIQLAENHGLTGRQLGLALRLVRERADEISEAWQSHFGR